MSSLAQRWKNLEAPFAQNNYDGSGEGLLLVGPLRGGDLVVTAPHAANHVRSGTPKWADRGTGGLALLLCEMAGVTAVIADRNTGTDANYDSDHPLKDAVADLSPTAVLDLHGMRAREYLTAEVDVGTGIGLVPGNFVDLLDEHLRVSANAMGTGGSGPHTVTGWAQRRGIPAVQLEIGVACRVPVANDSDAARLVEALLAAITKIAQSPCS